MHVSPVHWACSTRESSIEVISLFVHAYPEGLKVLDEDGLLPIHYACQNDAPSEIMSLLIKGYPEGIKLPAK